jgi:alanine racemase
MRAEVNLEMVRGNVKSIKKAIGKRLLMVCVKGDGYGHGMVEVARAALEGGADRLSVANVAEGVELRRAGIGGAIQVLIEAQVEDSEAIYQCNLIPSISTFDNAKKMATRLPGKIKVHVEVDTGMGRVLLKPAEVLQFLHDLNRMNKFEIEGLFSHFSSAAQPEDDEMRSFTDHQLSTFLELVRKCESGGLHIPIKHIAASGGTAYYPKSYLDMVRPGFIVYGYGWDVPNIKTKQVLNWKTRVQCVRQISAGEELGYDRGFIAEKQTVVAIIKGGYADGYPRALSGQADVLIGGQRARLVGMVGMDQMFAEVDRIPGVSIGDEVVLIGTQKDESILATDLAKILKTTAAEISCQISKRVPRVYLHQSC